MNAEPQTCAVSGEILDLEMERDSEDQICENCAESASPQARNPIYIHECPVFRVVMTPEHHGGMR